jgi:hypothetical protein
MSDYLWMEKESNMSKEEWNSHQKWVQEFSLIKWLQSSFDGKYVKVDGKGPGIFIEDNKSISKPSKWNYDVADSSE